MNGPCSQHSIFSMPWKWTEWARVFVAGKPFELNGMQHSILLGPFLRYYKNEVLGIQLIIGAAKIHYVHNVSKLNE